MQHTTPVSPSFESIHTDELHQVSGGCKSKCGGCGCARQIQKFIFNMAQPQQAAPQFDPSQMAQAPQFQPQYPQPSQPQFQPPMGGGFGPYVSTNVSFGQQPIGPSGQTATA